MRRHCHPLLLISARVRSNRVVIRHVDSALKCNTVPYVKKVERLDVATDRLSTKKRLDILAETFYYETNRRYVSHSHCRTLGKIN